MGDMGTIAKKGGIGSGIYEQEEPIYILKEQAEEENLFKINNSVRTLLEDLENNNKILTEQKDENKAQ
jgi:hypothetical protein